LVWSSQVETMRLAVIAWLLTVAAADVYDVVMPYYLAPKGCKCMPWTSVNPSNGTEQARIDSYWLNGYPPPDAESKCALPAASAGRYECDGCTVDTVWNSFLGPWCYCEDADPAGRGSPSGHEAYCQPPIGVPEQINLQLASSDTVVVSFVTFDANNSSDIRAEAMLGESKDAMSTVTGVSHRYTQLSETEHNNYVLHFVKFGPLKPRQQYFYMVRSQDNSGGNDTGYWSDTFNFRAPYGSGETRVASYGDMGHSLHNCMANVYRDCLEGKVDAVLHMGDHAYDMGQGGDKRGDSYMNAFQRALTACPWIPVIGNHEGNDGDNTARFLNMTFGESGFGLTGIHSTATTALGELLTKGTMFAAATHGSGAPSYTSRYFSVDIGLIHFANLDLNGGAADIAPETAQMQWLHNDLESVDRSVTPWVILTCHFPLYEDGTANNMRASAAYYTGEEAEKYTTSGHNFVARHCDEKGVCEQSVGEFQASIQGYLDPVLHQYKVDVFNSGHIHMYNSNWPICYNTTSNASSICLDPWDGSEIKSFVDPRGTVHVTDGNGGVPGVVGTYAVSNTSCTQPWCRAQSQGAGYGRWITSDAMTLRYEHVQNSDGNVSDAWEIKRGI